MSACVRGGGLLSPQSRSHPLARSVLVATVAGFGVGLLIGWRRGR